MGVVTIIVVVVSVFDVFMALLCGMNDHKKDELEFEEWVANHCKNRGETE